jgi:hypothetical protein
LLQNGEILGVGCDVPAYKSPVTRRQLRQRRIGGQRALREDWFGSAIQRTKLYQPDFDVQRGLLVGFAYKRVDFTTYVFNPEVSRPTVVLAIGIRF